MSTQQPITFSYPIERKYADAIRVSAPYIHQDAAVLAIRLALADLNECWADEHANLQQRTIRLQNELISARELEQRLQAGLNQTMLENDVLEAECNRLKQMISASSQPTTATTAPSAPAASNTSKPPAPTPPSPAASTTASADPAAPASSATTTPRKPGRPPTPKPPATHPLPSAESAAAGNPLTGNHEEAGQTTTPNPIDWATALNGLLSRQDIRRLEDGDELKWIRLEKQTQRDLILLIAETLYSHFGTLSISIFDQYRPAWTTSVASWSKTTNIKWIDVLNHLRIVPQNLPLASRIVPSATNS